MQATTDVAGMILSATGWAEGELESELERKQGEFAGLLTKEGALELIAREHGVQPPKTQVARNFSPLNSIRASEEEVNVRVRVWHVFATKLFYKKTPFGIREGRVRNVLVKDSSGEAMLVLWGRDADWPDSAGVRRNDALEVLGAFARQGASNLELHSRLSTRISPLQGDVDASPLPSYSKLPLTSGQLSAGQYDVDFLGTVARLGRSSEFQRVKKTGEVEKGLVFDCVLDAGEPMRVVAWDSNASALAKASLGDEVLIEGGSVKASREGSGLELHAGWSSHVVIKKGARQPTASSFQKLGEIGEGGHGVALVSLASLANAWSLLKCPSCGQKTPLKPDSQLSCSCGGQLKKLFVVRGTLQDESSSLECVFFNDEALAVMELSAVPVDAGAVLELKKEQLLGRKFEVSLRVKRSDFTQSLEAIASKVKAQV